MRNDREIVDLVDEMNWEDSEKIEKLSLEEAGVEEENCNDLSFKNSIYSYTSWFYDGDDISYEL